jgi:hypothetical protein
MKGIAAMSFLPKTSIELVNGSADQSTQAIRALLGKIADIQSNGDANLDGVNVICNGNSPYANATWEISNVKASGTATLTSAVATDAVTINGLLYTAVAGAPADATEFSIDTGDTEAAASLANAINTDVRVGTVASGVTATSALGVVTISAAESGIEGNTITTVSADATIVMSGATLSGGVGFKCTFQEEDSFLSADSIGRTALSTRRLIDVDLNISAFEFSVRSLLSVVNFIEKLEDKVASTGTGSTGDGTYTNVVLKGSTPYESFTWTVVKSGNDYTVTPTANS